MRSKERDYLRNIVLRSHLFLKLRSGCQKNLVAQGSGKLETEAALFLGITISIPLEQSPTTNEPRYHPQSRHHSPPPYFTSPDAPSPNNSHTLFGASYSPSVTGLYSQSKPKALGPPVSSPFSVAQTGGALNATTLTLNPYL